MDMAILYSLIGMFLHHPIGVVPGWKLPMGYLVIG